MPIYKFNILDGHFYPDLEGTDLPDLDSARIEAVRLFGALLKDDPIAFWNGDEWRMEVTDSAGLILFELAFTGSDVPAAQRQGALAGVDPDRRRIHALTVRRDLVFGSDLMHIISVSID